MAMIGTLTNHIYSTQAAGSSTPWESTKTHTAIGYLLLRWTPGSRPLQVATGDLGQSISPIAMSCKSLSASGLVSEAPFTGSAQCHLLQSSIEFYSTILCSLLCLTP